MKQDEAEEKHYQHALNVYNTLHCERLRDYLLAYLKTDVLLLADVFENFRDMSMNNYNLDPANYLTAPGLAWDAMLLKTRVELELISDLELLNFMEDMKRGGLCFVGSKRHVKANNKYLPDHDPSKPSNYIMYWDANGLYARAMNQPLPYRNIRFNREITWDTIRNLPPDAPKGYALRVNFEFPEHLHDLYKEFPPCPENMIPDKEHSHSIRRN